MKPAENVLSDLLALGEVSVRGETITFDWFFDEPVGLLDEARGRKAELLVLLGQPQPEVVGGPGGQEAVAGWSPMRWRAFHQDRLKDSPRPYECCQAELMNRSPLPASEQGVCAACGQNGAGVPIGPEPCAWVHSECWRGWSDARRDAAAAALAAMGIVP